MHRWLAILVLFLTSPAFAQDPQPLPELEPFLQEVRKHLRSDSTLLRQYTFNETTSLNVVNKKDKPLEKEVKVYEVFPADDEKLTYRRLVSKNGKPVDPKKLANQDRKHAKKMKQLNPKKRQKKEAAARAKEQKTISEIFQLFEFKILGREVIEEHPTIRLSFEPRANFKPKIKDVKRLKKIRGEAWISESDHQVVRVEAVLIKAFSIGLGVIAKLKKGSTMTFQRRKINDEIWLPAEAHFSGSGKVLLLVGFQVEYSSLYSNYQKFSVDSSITYQPDQN